MGPAPTEVQLPARARRYLARGDAELIYNPYDTSTWRVKVASAPWLYLKAGPLGHHPSLRDERDRLLWLAARGAAVPEVVDMGAGADVEPTTPHSRHRPALVPPPFRCQVQGGVTRGRNRTVSTPPRPATTTPA